MSTWVAYVKNLLAYYLGTQDDKYLLTQDGLRLWIVDFEWNGLTKY